MIDGPRLSPLPGEVKIESLTSLAGMAHLFAPFYFSLEV